ncbi:MAG: transposase [Deltaproteobacteria bacterium]|nr:MAG: transposase [Deltaproteobacteria bacterium]
MARPLRIQYPGAFYHITSRGNELKDVFKSQKDREKFLSYFETATHRYGALIHVYCLMNNHYHILMETPEGNLSQIMHHINASYTTYFNVKRKRAGHLFQGRYKAILVDADEYAKELSRYIHLNPVRAGIVDDPGKYSWSSCRYYIGQEKASEWLSRDFILAYFGKTVSVAKKRYREFVSSLIGKEYESPLKGVVGATILGSLDFVKDITEKHLKTKKVDRDLPAIRMLSKRPSLERIEKEVEAVIDEDEVLLRQVSLYFYHKYSGKTLKEIGTHFGIGESAVSQASRRLVLKMPNEAKLRKKIRMIEKRLIMSRV